MLVLPKSHQELFEGYIKATSRLIEEFRKDARTPRRELISWANEYAKDYDLKPFDREEIAPYEDYWQDDDDEIRGEHCPSCGVPRCDFHKLDCKIGVW